MTQLSNFLLRNIGDIKKKVVKLVRAPHIFCGNATEETISMFLELDSNVSDGVIILVDLRYKIVKGKKKGKTEEN